MGDVDRSLIGGAVMAVWLNDTLRSVGDRGVSITVCAEILLTNSLTCVANSSN
jgi:hypothetical protein